MHQYPNDAKKGSIEGRGKGENPSFRFYTPVRHHRDSALDSFSQVSRERGGHGGELVGMWGQYLLKRASNTRVPSGSTRSVLQQFVI